MAMTPFHKEVLKKCLPTLCDDLDAQYLIPHLIAADVLTDRDQEDLDAVPQRYKKAEMLIDIVRRRGDRAYGALLEALDESDGSSHLADELRSTENVLRQPQSQQTQGNSVNAALPRPRNPSRALVDKDLTQIAGKFGPEWKQVARTLGLSNAEVFHCEEENRYSVHDQVFAMLHKWKCKKQFNATVGYLYDSLVDIENVEPDVLSILALL